MGIDGSCIRPGAEKLRDCCDIKVTHSLNQRGRLPRLCRLHCLRVRSTVVGSGLSCTI
jgi:hypothetical protein